MLEQVNKPRAHNGLHKMRVATASVRRGETALELATGTIAITNNLPHIAERQLKRCSEQRQRKGRVCQPHAVRSVDLQHIPELRTESEEAQHVVERAP